MKNYKIYSFIFLFLLTFSLSYAEQEPISVATTDHIKEIIYNPNGIHKYTGFFGYPASILLENGEQVDSIVTGNKGWDIQVKGNRIFLKPIESNSNTNATILTNKRVYLFQLYAEEAKDINDPRIAYEVRFRYPAERIDENINSQESRIEAINNLFDKPYLNFNYTISGTDLIKPLKIFDDGQFTYLEFRDINAELPGIFLVDSEGYEALINYHISGNYVVIEIVAPRFTLRHGNEYACIFNENMKYKKIKTKKLGLFKINQK